MFGWVYVFIHMCVGAYGGQRSHLGTILSCHPLCFLRHDLSVGPGTCWFSLVPVSSLDMPPQHVGKWVHKHLPTELDLQYTLLHFDGIFKQLSVEVFNKVVSQIELVVRSSIFLFTWEGLSLCPAGHGCCGVYLQNATAVRLRDMMPRRDKPWSLCALIPSKKNPQ